MSTAAYYRLKNRRERHDPTVGLHRTHVFAADDSLIETDVSFPTRTSPVTFAFTLARSAAASGLVLEIGSADRGIGVWLDGADLGVGAGAGEAASQDDGVTVLLEDALPDVDLTFKFILSVVPGTGLVEVYRDGQLLAFGESVNGTFDGAWADSDDGAIGQSTGTIVDRVPVGSQGALTNAAIVGSVSVYNNQRALA